MNSLSEIKHRIKAVGDTRKITKAMEMVSIAKMRAIYGIFRQNAKCYV